MYRAIEFEAKRQVEVLEQGGEITMETMGFDAVTGETKAMRSKEMAHDYRYFPEPDLQAIFVGESYVAEVNETLPALPKELIEKYTKKLGLSEYDAQVITEDKYFALFYEDLINLTTNYKSAANWMMGTIKSYLNENALDIKDLPLTPKHIAGLIELIDSGAINNSIANQKVFPALVKQPELSAKELAEKKQLDSRK